MQRIALNKGLYAIVDDEDFEIVSRFKWYAHPTNGSREPYAVRTSKPNVRMHRFIMNALPGTIIDHVNGSTLDNQKSNLRFCTHSQNMINRKKTPASSKYKGVYKSGAGWRAKADRNDLGTFATEIEAALVYDIAAIEQFGSFARPNFTEEQRLLLLQSFENSLPIRIFHKKSHSCYRGVTKCSRTGKFISRLHFHGECIDLGRYINEKDAAIAWDQKSLELGINKHKLNFPELTYE